MAGVAVRGLTDDDYVDAVRQQLASQALGHALDAVLRGGVGRHEGRAVLAAN